jgi:hypothetical protein
MATTRGSERGISMVEATIILVVVLLLTAVLAPSLHDFVVDARAVRARADCEAISMSLMRLVLDVGPCLRLDGAEDCTPGNRVHVLFSRGANAGWPAANADSMERQFTTNQARYPLPVWQGAYLPAPVGPDPWGSAYAVNIRYLAPQSPDECLIDTFCVSAGPNRKYDTPFNRNPRAGTTSDGDDLTVIINGGRNSVSRPDSPTSR